MSNQKNPILKAHWGETKLEGDTYVTPLRIRLRAMRIRVSPHVWIPNWFGAPFACHCVRHLC